MGTLWGLLQESGKLDLPHPVLKGYVYFITVLLVFVPLALLSAVMYFSPKIIFALNFLAIIRLSAIVQQYTLRLKTFPST